MILRIASSAEDMKRFYEIPARVYRNNPCYHRTPEETARLLGGGKSRFHTHSEVVPLLIETEGVVQGRFFFIHDQRQPEYLQVASFEALPGLKNLGEKIVQKGRELFPACHRMVAGLNGHLNYGAGILLNQFHIPPVYELPYNPPYYAEYFQDFKKRELVSFRFNMEPFYRYIEQAQKRKQNSITTRYLNKKKFKQDIALYTQLNNSCFTDHPFWSHRDQEEDLEIFGSIRRFINRENLIFAEYNKKPIGFILWFPDFNQLVKPGHHLGFRHWIKFRTKHNIKTFRLMEIGILPEYQISTASFSLISKMVETLKAQGYRDGEGGFIFKDNEDSIRLVNRYFRRGLKKKSGPFRKYGVFEKEL